MARGGVDLPRGAKVLVRLPNWLGDVILCTPSLEALRRIRPDLELHALVKPAVRVAVEGLQGIASVRLLEGTSFAQTLSHARRLRRESFHAALVFPKGFREALLPWLACIPVRIGLATDRRRFLLNHPVAFDEKDWHEHHAHQFAKVLSPLGVALRDEGLSFPLSEDERDEGCRILGEAGLDAESLAVFHIGASKAPRAWHAERFGEVAQALYEAKGLRPVLVGTPQDAPFHAAFKNVCREAVDLAGKTSLKTMAAVIERARLFVGNDSGPMHVAAALGTPVVAVFGPGAPHKTAPFLSADRCRVIHAALPCSPCRQAFWKECSPCTSGKPACLEGVVPSAVLHACLDLLERP
jgi:heptosyltransferase-2